MAPTPPHFGSGCEPTKYLDVPWKVTGSTVKMAAMIVALGTLTLATFVLPGWATASVQPLSAAGSVTVTTSACGPRWAAPKSGQRTFAVTNSTRQPFEVELVGASQVWVYGDIEVLAPRTTRPLTVVLPRGRFWWRCTGLDGTVTYSRSERVSGRKVTAHPYLPVDYSQLQLITGTYRAEVAAGLSQLVSDTDKLTAALTSGQLAEAKALWLPAHLDYERLGAAYGTFGNYDDEINGLPNRLPGGAADPRFTGFHRLEYGLWQGQSPATLVPVANALDAAVHGLQNAFPQLETDPNDVALRTHEILENALQFELTGESDMGSHTSLATTLANVQGTESTLSAISSLLARENPKLLDRARTGLAGLATLLQSYQRPSGTWVPLQSLTTTQREQLDGTVSALLEQLAPIADVLALPPSPNSD
jgi:high-affinity iron transporter